MVEAEADDRDADFIDTKPFLVIPSIRPFRWPAASATGPPRHARKIIALTTTTCQGLL